MQYFLSIDFISILDLGNSLLKPAKTTGQLIIGKISGMYKIERYAISLI